MMSTTSYKVIGLTALGGALEFYDFTIYALFAPYISQHFFRHTTPFIGLLNTFAVFALGYFARPLGGIVFGHIGDRLGRKVAFSLSVLCMAIATLLIGLLPSYQTIGMIAPLMLILLRMVQGFSVGGEIPGAAIFILEHVPKHQRGMANGIIFMSITFGNLLGAFVGFGLTNVLSPQAMGVWGWRLPFILGFFLGIISFIIRKKTTETPEFLSILKTNQLHKVPCLNVLKFSRRPLLASFLLTSLMSSILSLFLFLPTYLSMTLHIKMDRVYLINMFSFLCLGLMTVFFGWLSDHSGRKKLIISGILIILICSYPLFYGLYRYGVPFIWVFIVVFSIGGGMTNGSYGVLIAESFPSNLRYSGMGLSYSFGIAIFGGMAPLMFTYLLNAFSTPEAPSFYLIFAAATALMGMVLSLRNLE